jgi:hypothetical protein
MMFVLIVYRFVGPQSSMATAYGLFPTWEAATKHFEESGTRHQDDYDDHVVLAVNSI